MLHIHKTSNYNNTSSSWNKKMGQRQMYKLMNSSVLLKHQKVIEVGEEQQALE